MTMPQINCEKHELTHKNKFSINQLSKSHPQFKKQNLEEINSYKTYAHGFEFTPN